MSSPANVTTGEETVTQYLVTISPVPEGGSDTASGPSMIVRIEVSGGTAHVIELNARAHAGGDLTANLPPVDLKRLAEVFGSVEAAPVPAHRPAAPARRASARPSAPAPAPKRARSGKEPEIRTARAYRKMPEAEELHGVYAEVGSIAGVARHYGVPTHTAQGWIGRLRKFDVDASGS
jgi:hypothetical protein